MKILYAIQGTGNGHITVAREVLPLLKKRADVDILVSGTQVDIGLPYEIRYRLHGLGFVFGKKGGIDYLETYKKGSIKTLFREIHALPVEEYDLVISDFEPVSAWACHLRNKPCIGFSHQAAVISKHAPRPAKNDLLGRAVLKYYAPTSHRYGFHFLPYDSGVSTPVIRSEIRNRVLTDEGHYTVYLPAYSDKKISRLLGQFPDTRWRVFSKHGDERRQEGSISFEPVSADAFIDSLVSGTGVLCNAGFQTPAESLFLRKKLLVVPMKGQYEQQCNGAALSLMGIPVLRNIKRRQYHRIKDWIETDVRFAMDYPDETEYLLDEIITRCIEGRFETGKPGKQLRSASAFRSFLLNKIFYKLGS